MKHKPEQGGEGKQMSYRNSERFDEEHIQEVRPPGTHRRYLMGGRVGWKKMRIRAGGMAYGEGVGWEQDMRRPVGRS